MSEAPTTRRWLALVLIGAGAAVVGVGVWFATRTVTPTEPGAVPSFVEEAVASGIEHVYDGEFTFFVGGGVAGFDCNGDQLPELYLAGGENPAALFVNQSTPGGSLSFERLSSEATDLTSVTGAYPIDIDSDGLLDLVVLRLGENVILRGLGGCRFERANETWAIEGGDAWTVGFSATWEGEAEWPTLAFGNYLHLDEKGQQFGGCADHQLFRPEGPGYGPPIVLAPGWCSLSILFSDWDRSGRRDLRVTNDRHYYRDGEEQLWRMGEEPLLYGRDEGWNRLQINGMGIASQDVTGDGVPEVYLTSQGDNKLQTLATVGGPAYEDIAIRRGVTAHRPVAGDTDMPSTAWHPEFQDVNNDGFLDLYVTKGNVEAQVDHAMRDPSNLFLGLPDGTFVESTEAAGLLDFASARGGALLDLNLDGLLDLVEVNRRTNVEVWRNVSDSIGNWVDLRLEQEAPNRDGIGSWIEVRVGDLTITREVSIGGGHASGHLDWYHFGLGPASRAEARVTWPDGEASEWFEVVTGGRYVAGRDDVERLEVGS